MSKKELEQAASGKNLYCVELSFSDKQTLAQLLIEILCEKILHSTQNNICI